MPRYRATLAYDGTDFQGFQRQATGRTVQGELDAVLSRMGWPEARLIGAGRTDSGVHAAGQVVAFDAEWTHGADDLLKAMNARLPADIALLDVAEAPADFNPRRWATSRRYRYAVYQSPQRHPLLERMAWQVWPPLSLERLNSAAQHLLGTHDFATFGTAPDDIGHTRRTVLRSEWQVAPGEMPGIEILHYNIQADAFLYRMVRTVVGTLKRVGQGEAEPGEMADVIGEMDRKRAGPAAPARGLCLMEVTYDERVAGHV